MSESSSIETIYALRKGAEENRPGKKTFGEIVRSFLISHSCPISDSLEKKLDRVVPAVVSELHNVNSNLEDLRVYCWSGARHDGTDVCDMCGVPLEFMRAVYMWGRDWFDGELINFGLLRRVTFALKKEIRDAGPAAAADPAPAQDLPICCPTCDPCNNC